MQPQPALHAPEVKVKRTRTHTCRSLTPLLLLQLSSACQRSRNVSTMTATGPRKTDAEARAHKRQLELLNEDAKRLCNVDISAPFKNMQDALDRLLPFHVGARVVLRARLLGLDLVFTLNKIISVQASTWLPDQTGASSSCPCLWSPADLQRP